jgi:hypothetical protein
MGTFPAEVICPRCSKPIRDNSVVLLRQGELFHVRCRSQEVNLEAMETVDRAQRAWGHSAKLAAGLVRLQIARSGSAHAGRCPLCGATATIAYASDEWTAVTECPCGGFFVWGPLMPHLPRLPEAARTTLRAGIRALRRQGSEAWLSTRDGMLAGALVVLPGPPGRGARGTDSGANGEPGPAETPGPLRRDWRSRRRRGLGVSDDAAPSQGA